MPRQSDDGFEALVKQLRITNRLLAAQLRSNMKQNDIILLLAGAGISNQDVADAVGTTAPTVANALVRMRKKTKGKNAEAGGGVS